MLVRTWEAGAAAGANGGDGWVSYALDNRHHAEDDDELSRPLMMPRSTKVLTQWCCLWLWFIVYKYYQRTQINHSYPCCCRSLDIVRRFDPSLQTALSIVYCTKTAASQTDYRQASMLRHGTLEWLLSFCADWRNNSKRSVWLWRQPLMVQGDSTLPRAS